MDIERLKQLVSKPILTLDEVKFILDSISNEIRSTMDVNNSNTRLCKESSFKVWDICSSISLPYIPFCNSELGMRALDHHYGITGFKTECGQICFLIDLTYIQFSNPTYNISSLGDPITILSPGELLSEPVKEHLITNGYLPLTEDTIMEYINGFTTSFNDLYVKNQQRQSLELNPIDEQEVFSNLYKKFKDRHINLAHPDYFGDLAVQNSKCR